VLYIRGTNDLNIRHNQAMAHMILMNFHQDKFQVIQDFHHQYVAMRKVCDEHDLHFGRCEDDVRAILKKRDKTNLITEQL